ncbi:hypothetical protein BLD44_017710 [Mastigocladus laminosus UU774]|nr:hypothetical protein B4U84_18790 [Westiellopsis prolifica IICB1]TFI53173.1 hypothetical protein BLD44_017710 [Mastigocladus laminosus UU774]
MPLFPDQIDKTIEEIDRLTNPSSQRYGRLLNWQNPPDPFWHYGIGLSDMHIFDTGRGLLTSHVKTRRWAFFFYHCKKMFK